jgi:hypothetical protein
VKLHRSVELQNLGSGSERVARGFARVAASTSAVPQATQSSGRALNTNRLTRPRHCSSPECRCRGLRSKRSAVQEGREAQVQRSRKHDPKLLPSGAYEEKYQEAYLLESANSVVSLSSSMLLDTLQFNSLLYADPCLFYLYAPGGSTGIHKFERVGTEREKKCKNSHGELLRWWSPT